MSAHTYEAAATFYECRAFKFGSHDPGDGIIGILAEISDIGGMLAAPAVILSTVIPGIVTSGMGLKAALPSALAREIAAELLRLADLLDAGVTDLRQVQ